VVGNGNIRCNVFAYPAPWKGQHDGLQSSLTTSFRGIALETSAVTPGHKMTRADARVWVVEQNAIGTNRLVAMVFNDSRYTQKPSKRKWQKGRVRNVNEIGGPDVLYQRGQPGPANYGKWQFGVIHATGWRFGNESQIDRFVVVRS